MAGDALLRYTEALYRAVQGRDRVRTTWLLGDELSVHLPREVIEEAIVLSRLAPDGLRAPLHLLRYYHRTLQLLRGPEAAREREAQLAFEFGRPVRAEIANALRDEEHV